MLLFQKQIAAADAGNLLGEWRALAEQLGSPEAFELFGTAAQSLRANGARKPAALKALLGTYYTQVLTPLELPAIYQAYWHALRNESRELVALDQRLGAEPFLGIFASASHRAGNMHLQRLRPLRDHRLVQRYLHAAETGEAHAWHTLVYGVTLAIFSVPLRQGLIHYAEQTLDGFAHSAGRAHRCSPRSLQKVLAAILAGVPQTVESALNNGTGDPRLPGKQDAAPRGK